MMIWHISQDTNNGYDTYSDAVVFAASEKDAREMHPSENGIRWDPEAKMWRYPGGLEHDNYSWVTPDKVAARMIGISIGADEVAKVVCASFHAG